MISKATKRINNKTHIKIILYETMQIRHLLDLHLLFCLFLSSRVSIFAINLSFNASKLVKVFTYHLKDLTLKNCRVRLFKGPTRV